MSVETLKADLKSNLETLRLMVPGVASPDELVRHLKDTLWPMLESIVEEVAEIDDCMNDIVSGAEDILQPETAEVFAGIIAGALAVAAALKMKVGNDTEEDRQLRKVIGELEANCRAGEELLKDVVIDPGDDDDGEDEETDDGDEDDDDGEATFNDR